MKKLIIVLVAVIELYATIGLCCSNELKFVSINGRELHVKVDCCQEFIPFFDEHMGSGERLCDDSHPDTSFHSSLQLCDSLSPRSIVMRDTSSFVEQQHITGSNPWTLRLSRQATRMVYYPYNTRRLVYNVYINGQWNLLETECVVLYDDSVTISWVKYNRSEKFAERQVDGTYLIKLN